MKKIFTILALFLAFLSVKSQDVGVLGLPLRDNPLATDRMYISPLVGGDYGVTWQRILDEIGDSLNVVWDTTEVKNYVNEKIGDSLQYYISYSDTTSLVITVKQLEDTILSLQGYWRQDISDSIAVATPDSTLYAYEADSANYADTANYATLSDSSRIASELSGFDKTDYVKFSDSLTTFVTPDQLADSLQTVQVDSVPYATFADSTRAASTAEASQGNFTASGDITGDNLISLGDITATFEVEAGTVRALDSVVTTQINMNGDEANGIAGSSQIDVLFHSVSFSDTTEVWGYKKVFMTNSGRMYAMVEPHVFLFNPVDPTGADQSVGTAWEKFSPGDSAFFEFSGRHGIDSVGNDTTGIVFSGHLWIDGSIGIAGSTGRTIDIRMYNVTKDEIVKSGGSVTTQGAGNRMDLNIKGYCINCHAGDKIIIQVKADQVTTFTFYRGEIRLDGNHGFE